jgi:hypothetical protein
VPEAVSHVAEDHFDPADESFCCLIIYAATNCLNVLVGLRLLTTGGCLADAGAETPAPTCRTQDHVPLAAHWAEPNAEDDHRTGPLTRMQATYAHLHEVPHPNPGQLGSKVE